VADDAAKAAAGAAAATAAALGGIVFARKGKRKDRETSLRDVSDEEVSRRAHDKSLSPEERQKAVTEEKFRRLRNKQKRGG
jgi:Flp pilus assembly protein TadB